MLRRLLYRFINNYKIVYFHLIHDRWMLIHLPLLRLPPQNITKTLLDIAYKVKLGCPESRVTSMYILN